MEYKKIVTSQNQDNPSGSFAAKACNEFTITVNGITYDDWYLPSLAELSLIYIHKELMGVNSNLSYWSSAETDSNNAAAQNLTFGNVVLNYVKGNHGSVRPIRSF